MKLGLLLKLGKFALLGLGAHAVAKMALAHPLFTCPKCGKQVTDLHDAWAPGGGVAVWYHYGCKPLGAQSPGEA